MRRVRKVRQIKKERHIDVTYSFGESASIINCLTGVGDRIVSGIHGGIILDNQRTMKLFCKRSDALISVSKAMTERIRSDYHSDKAVTVYNPVDIEDISKRSMEPVTDHPFEDREHVIVTVGREDDQKGYWHLIKAFSLLEDKSYKLMIIGSGDFAAYEKLSLELGLEDRVVFTGLKKNPFAYERGCALYVLSSNHEGFPGAMLEAMALGIPVVAADCETGPREILIPDGDAASRIGEPVHGMGGILIPDMDHEADMDPCHITDDDRMLCKAMTEMLSDPVKRDRAAVSGRERVRAFSAESYIRDISTVLRI